VFLNLLHNAAQSIDRRGCIVVRTHRENGSVIAEVEDNGCGMAPEVMERVFEPFYTTKPRGMGTGLGLSIARKIVEKHGGSIEVKSEPGRGTKFRMSFPLVENARAGQQAPE
jgi:signal transduction histidine kinase